MPTQVVVEAAASQARRAGESGPGFNASINRAHQQDALPGLRLAIPNQQSSPRRLQVRMRVRADKSSLNTLSKAPLDEAQARYRRWRHMTVSVSLPGSRRGQEPPDFETIP